MANSLCDGDGNESRSTEDQNTKKVRFKDNNVDTDMDIIMELPHEPTLS